MEHRIFCLCKNPFFIHFSCRREGGSQSKCSKTSLVETIHKSEFSMKKWPKKIAETILGVALKRFK